MPDANELLRIQHEVTSERDPERRLAAIEQAYVEDLKFLDSEADVVGRQAFSDRLQKILAARQSCDPRDGCTHAA